jgi:hypothetical protein
LGDLLALRFESGFGLLEISRLDRREAVDFEELAEFCLVDRLLIGHRQQLVQLIFGDRRDLGVPIIVIARGDVE